MKPNIWIPSAILLAVLGLLCGFEKRESASASAPVSIAVATDLHYLSPTLTDHSEYFMQSIEAGDGKVVQYIDEITDAFFAELTESRPDYLILSGDLTFAGAVKSHEDLIEKLHTLQEGGIQVLVIPGNHDMDREYAIEFRDGGAQKTEALTSPQFAEMYWEFGPAQAISWDRVTFSYTIQAAEDLRIILLDANSYGTGWLKDVTLAWLEQELRQAQEQGDRVITVSHQNLHAHNAELSVGYQLSNAGELQPLLEEYGVLCNLSGHIHAQSIVNGQVPEITTSSLAVSPNQYGILTYTGQSLTYRSAQVDVAGWAEKTGCTDANLLDFSQYTESFFKENCRRQVREMFAGSELTEEEITLLAETFAKLNQAYFAGRAPDYETLKEGIGLWSEQEGIFLLSYIKTILSANWDRQTLTVEWEN